MFLKRVTLSVAIALAWPATSWAESYEIRVENLAPAGGVYLTPVWVGFHNGDFNLFAQGAPASTELERLAEDGDVASLDASFRATGAGRTSAVVLDPQGFPGAPVLDPGAVARATIELDPTQHRYLSYASMVIPSNDAFVGNENATGIELFHADGSFRGVVSFVVYGRSVWDAGTEANTEEAAAFLNQIAPNQGTQENVVVGRHIGYNGSASNPNGAPVNVLGGNFMGINFDPITADFSRAPYPLMRVTIAPAGERVRVRIRNRQATGGLFFTPFWVGFHDGEFDLYDRGAPASLGIERVAEDGDTAELSQLFAGNGVDATIVEPEGFAGAPVFEPGSVADRTFLLSPEQDRYFSYASMVLPSNDAFVANGEPRQFQIFDAQGQFTPQRFVVTGGMVLDAGTEANTETAAAFLNQTAPNQGVSEANGVMLHPGFNGSRSNPAGTPVNILGGTNAAGALIDRDIADFSRGNPNLVEFTVTRAVDASFSGTWYNAERSGEGYMLDISERDGARYGVLSGYTYAPDGSGAPLWFIGEGPIIDDTLTALVYTARGGRLFATTNPTNVMRSHIGTARLQFGSCTDATFSFMPADGAALGGAVGSVTLPLTRLTTPGSGLIAACSNN